MWCIITARETGLNHYDGIVLSWPPVVDECQKHKENQYYSALQFVTEDLTNRRPPYGSGALSALRLIDIQFSHHIGFDWAHFLKLASVIFVSLVLTIMMSNSTSPSLIYRARMPVPNLKN